MKHRKKGRGLGLPTDRRRALVRNLMRSLILHESITTTEARAQAVQRHVESLVTVARKDTLHSRRMALSTLPDQGAVNVLIHDIAPRYVDRAGGYTRVTRVGLRKGDGASLARLEFIVVAE